MFSNRATVALILTPILFMLLYCVLGYHIREQRRPYPYASRVVRDLFTAQKDLQSFLHERRGR